MGRQCVQVRTTYMRDVQAEDGQLVSVEGQEELKMQRRERRNV